MIINRIELTQLDKRIRLEAYHECFEEPVIDIEIDRFDSHRYRKTLVDEDSCIIQGNSVQESELIIDKTVRDGKVEVIAELIHDRLTD